MKCPQYLCLCNLLVELEIDESWGTKNRVTSFKQPEGHIMWFLHGTCADCFYDLSLR